VNFKKGVLSLVEKSRYRLQGDQILWFRPSWSSVEQERGGHLVEGDEGAVGRVGQASVARAGQHDVGAPAVKAHDVDGAGCAAVDAVA
jgi:hypothetical protein